MKNLLSFLLFTITTSVCIAQLYVKPIDADSSGDVSLNDAPAFVYANNAIVYVEGPIGLTLNPTNTTSNVDGEFEGSFYLRGTSQLFQGGTAAANTGDGLLSVYQTSHSDAWDYNFWASPVGQPSGAPGNRQYGALRFYDIEGGSLTRSTQTLITAALNGWSGTGTSTADPTLDMTISRRWLHTFDPVNGWVRINSNEIVPVGQGFTMKGLNNSGTHTEQYVDPNAQIYDFRGRPNSGTIPVTITEEASILTGNPYPSALDLARVFELNTPDLIDHIQFWDEDRSVNSHLFVDNKGGYAQWIPMGADSNNNLPGMYTPAPFLSYTSAGVEIPNSNPTGYDGENLSRRYAPIGQGFMILGRDFDPGDPTVNTDIIEFTNAMRVYNPIGVNGSIFRNNGTNGASSLAPTPVPQNDPSGVLVSATVENEIPHLILNAYIPGSHRRIMALAFSNKASDDFDYGYDATHPMDATTEVYMPLPNSKKTVIQTTNFDPQKAIPIGIEADIPGTILFSAIEENNMPVESAWLYDASLNTYQMITDGKFANINIEQAGTIEFRYFIVFQNKEIVENSIAEKSGLNLAKATVDVFQNNRMGIMEILNPEKFDIAKAQVFDMSGKLVHSENSIGAETRYNFPTASFANGVYIVKLTTKENLILDYKVTVYNTH